MCRGPAGAGFVSARAAPTVAGPWLEYMVFGGAEGAVMDRVRASEIQSLSDQGTGGAGVIAQLASHEANGVAPVKPHEQARCYLAIDDTRRCRCRFGEQPAFPLGILSILSIARSIHSPGIPTRSSPGCAVGRRARHGADSAGHAVRGSVRERAHRA